MRLKRDTDSGRSPSASSGSMPIAQDVRFRSHVSQQSAVVSAPSLSSLPSRQPQERLLIANRKVRAVAARQANLRGKLPSPRLRCWSRLIGGGLYYRSTHQAPKLTSKDTIVLADFENKSGDAVFDDTLRQALTVALNQSPYSNVLGDNKVADYPEAHG